ncbi:MAG: hypothetical protein J6T94_12120 [Bacteroidaceae bacterium]|nr:hypothetical protein [Bacteroidaceae bacterium]
MNRRFQNEEIKCVSRQYAENELFKAVSSIGPQLESELTEFGLCSEECFMEVVELLSIIAEKGEDILPELDNIWLGKSNEYRRLSRQVERVNKDEEISKAVGIVFGFTILALDSSRHPFYRRTLPERLMQVVACHKFDGWVSTFERIFSVPLPDGWFDAFINEGLPAATPPSGKKAKTNKTKKKVESQSDTKPKTLKYYKHGNNSVLMKQRKRVDIVFDKWKEWGWIDVDTNPDDFDAFFEGEPRYCNIEWKANTTILTILLQELLQQSYIQDQTGCAAKSLVKEQFRKTANSDRTRLDDDAKEKIQITLLVLDINNPLPERHTGNANDKYDIQDAALKEIFAGQLRSTKGI